LERLLVLVGRSRRVTEELALNDGEMMEATRVAATDEATLSQVNVLVTFNVDEFPPFMTTVVFS
jgi:hypothetical protein